jgi:hypothetical protein
MPTAHVQDVDRDVDEDQFPVIGSSRVTPQTSASDKQHQHIAFVLCGALAREVRAIVQRHGWDVRLFGVTALDHLHPERIGPDVERRLRELIPQYERVVVVYGDCGSGGQLDQVLARYHVPRIAGPHCYEMYAGKQFEALITEEPGTFFLTDFLVRSFNGTVVKGLGIDRFPELKPLYFGNYTRLVYLAQDADEHVIAKAHEISEWLHLPLDVHRTGFGLLETRLVALMAEIWDERYQPILPPIDMEDCNGNVSNPVLARHSRSSARDRRRRTAECTPTGSLSGGSGSSRVDGRADRC